MTRWKLQILSHPLIGWTEVIFMAYRISYAPPVPESHRPQKDPLRLQVMTAVCLLVFTLLVKTWFPAGTDKLRQLLIPDVPSVTQQALDGFVIDIREGDPLADAFTAFCQHIISHGQALSS